MGKEEEKDLWKKGSTYLTAKLIPVIPVVPASSGFNSGLGLSYTTVRLWDAATEKEVFARSKQ